ncbi:hypothetical protein IT418_02680 [bacterium]|nr:hypothetical protein [bacterium]
MEIVNMSSHKFVILQTALRPLNLVSVESTEYTQTDVTDYSELFAAIEKIPFTSETILLINRGPGSYTGIRTSIAYAYGLLHGGLLTANHVFSYTSFDYVRAATTHKGPIYLKSWPRIKTGKVDESRGYFEKEGEISYKTWEDVHVEKNLLVVSEENLTTQHECRTYEDLLHDAIGFRELANDHLTLSKSLEPLYINPVHIT